MEKEDKKDNGPKSPSPVRKSNNKFKETLKDQNLTDEVVANKKNLEEEKEDNEPNEPVVGGPDSDNELDDDEYGKQIDNSQPLKDEQGRGKFQKSKPLPMFKELFSSEICAALKRFGGSPAPLSLIGTFLSYVGNNILYYLHDKYKARVFYPHSEVISIRH